jgi:hypothetical protein
MFRNSLATALALASIALPAAARAQTASPASVPQAPSVAAPETSAPSAQLQQWVSELKLIEEKLDGLEQQALKDPALQHEQEELGAVIVATMIRMDPSIEARFERLTQILAEAQTPGIDEARLKALAAEVETIHPILAGVQARAMEDPTVDQRVRAYKDSLDKHLAQIDPGAVQLLARRTELQRMIVRAGQ